jgi:hypothetical protein
MTKEELRVIYDREHSQVGDTEEDFNNWAIEYLIEKIVNKQSLKTIKRHLIGIEKAVEKLEKE